jgi:hypothetical protein
MSVRDSLRPQRWTLGLLLIVLACSSESRATILPPGGSVVPSRTASPFGAALAVDSGAVPFASVDGSSFTGTLRTQVYMHDANNPFGLNFMTFVFVLADDGPDALERLVTIDFPLDYQIDVAFSDLIPGVIPATVDRSTVSANRARVIGWNWPASSALGAQQQSPLLVIHTSAPYFVPTLASVIDGSVATVPSFGLYVPEPPAFAVVAALAVVLFIRNPRLAIRFNWGF